VINLTVVLDNTTRNAPGTQFINTATWQFGRLIDGVYYEPLPGEWGITPPMTIVGPDPAVPPPTKALVSPATPEATIGQEVVYEIRVPGTASTRPLYDVVVTDTLDANLDYLGFIQTGGPPATDQSVAPGLSFRVDQIPAGQQAVFQVRARVRNVLTAQQGVAISNTAFYTYSNTSEPHSPRSPAGP
jgi:uncharacterized repeat protein (TIGR01451 family)